MTLCGGFVQNDNPCPFKALSGLTLCELHYAAWRWRYDPTRASEYAGHTEPATEKQTAYIAYLQAKNPAIADEVEQAINAFGSPASYNALTTCTKGQAMFIIKCLKGEIEPRRWEPEE